MTEQKGFENPFKFSYLLSRPGSEERQEKFRSKEKNNFSFLLFLLLRVCHHKKREAATSTAVAITHAC